MESNFLNEYERGKINAYSNVIAGTTSVIKKCFVDKGKTEAEALAFLQGMWEQVLKITFSKYVGNDKGGE